jgi:hypothetical protein
LEKKIFLKAEKPKRKENENEGRLEETDKFKRVAGAFNELSCVFALAALPHDAPTDHLEKKIYFQFTDETRTQIRVHIYPPYPLKQPALNELGLLQKEFYTTKDLCEILDLHPDTLRYRLRKGIYPEPKKRAGDKRRFTLDEIKELIKITEQFPQKKWKLRE